ncbi:MAG: reverse transcriptase domain-containing protein [bacterium]
MNNRQRNFIGGEARRDGFVHSFESIISKDNLLSAWREFKRGKGKKIDVQRFAFYLEDNIWALHQALANKTYQHGAYARFYVRDPKLRLISKAGVSDRLLHHAIFRVLDPVFDLGFIYDSCSCRLGKGIHQGIGRLAKLAGQCSKNYVGSCYALQGDIKKFFDNIDHDILFSLIAKKIADQDTLRLIRIIIDSFNQTTGRGLPLGNVTSQLFANIYLNELDQFVKRELRVKYYLRYCDDFVILHDDTDYLRRLTPIIKQWLKQKLELDLHPQKISIRKLRQGIDWLGYVTFPHYRLLRAKTKKRMIKKIKSQSQDYANGYLAGDSFNQTLQSYYGLLSHGKCYTIKRLIQYQP